MTRHRAQARRPIAILVGTRPEIVKMAPVVRACARRRAPHFLVHTGQHYSYELDGLFFEELGLRAPDVQLRAGSASHASQVARIVAGLEPVLTERRPSVLLVEGDTNSVLAGALAAAFVGVPVGHVEAGLRSYDRSMPEERNRIVVDHLSDTLYAPTARARSILIGEGVERRRILVTGNTVVDELLRERRKALTRAPWRAFGLEPGRYAVATVHRAENTDDEARLRGILAGLERVASRCRLPVVLPLHPRTRARLASARIEPGAGVRTIEPAGYLTFVGLCAAAALILTDSGGLQEEACVLRVPCVTLRDTTERPEAVEVGASLLAGASARRIVTCAERLLARPRRWRNPFGDGRAGERIVAHCVRPA